VDTKCLGEKQSGGFNNLENLLKRNVKNEEEEREHMPQYNAAPGL
jgi:hypothetical protein